MTSHYTRRWLQVMVPILAVLFVTGLILVPLVGFILGVIAVSTYCALISILCWPACKPTSSVVRRAATWAALSGLGTGATAALVAVHRTELLPPGLLLVALTCPPVVSQLRRLVPDPRRPRPMLQTISDAQLCCAWRTTTAALRVMTTPHEQLVIAGRRQEYLDEMVRRHPAGFQAWIESGECADAALEGFLVRDRGAGT